MDQFTADPSARVFGDKIYVYPSHDIPCREGQGFIGFCMADYHVFSSENLTDWTDHGVILTQENVTWVDATSYSMWAPDCIYRNGKYYFYFPAISKDTADRRRIGVAISDTPTGPFTPEARYMEGVSGIDPNPFIDTDGQAYLYWGAGEDLRMAKLSDSMLELASEPRVVAELPDKFKEGPYLFERNGIYYFTFPHVVNKTERLVYATGNSPMGPFTYRGVIMDESPIDCWTNHHSIIEFKGQWYLFYHHNDLSPDFDKNRSIRADSLSFSADGTIKKVTPTLRGVGITQANSRIQPDRYSRISKKGANIAFLDTRNKHAGWKTILHSNKAWVQYNAVDFSQIGLKHVTLKAASEKGGTLAIRLNHTGGRLIANVRIGKDTNWEQIRSELSEIPTGIHDLVIVLLEGKDVELDWISFE
jgi:hypothetical protein